MKTLVAWLRRIQGAAPADLRVSQFRLWIPGFEPLALTDFLMHCEPQPVPKQLVEGSSPTAQSLLRILDVPQFTNNMNERHRLGAELAGLLTLALGRRVEIGHEVMISVPHVGRVLRLPFANIVDHTVLGPPPAGPQAAIERLLQTVLGLGEDDLDVIGAASSMYQSAILLFDRDARAAYALLIGGIEVLSRVYGEPPRDWSSWDQAPAWDEFLAVNSLTPAQSASLRHRLLQDKQLRLKATFRSYASERLPSSFWAQPWNEWTYGVFANEDTWTQAVAAEGRVVGDLFGEDRPALSRALGKSYDLRSSFVHRGDWIELFQLSIRAKTPVNLDAPLPFAVLRAILGELIIAEATARAVAVTLPDVVIIGTGGPGTA